MSNVACIPEDTANYLGMDINEPKTVIQFGSMSHDGTIRIENVATFQDNKYLPHFAVTTSGSMPILPTFWLTQMGYSITILPYERGFQIVDSDSLKIVYEGKQHADKFHYVPWDILKQLEPTHRSRIIVPSERVYSSVNFMEYSNEVCMYLDVIDNDMSEKMNCNATTRQRNHIPTQTIQDICEAHARYGHQSPRQMAETIARQARADIPKYTAEEIRKVSKAWPCIYCKAAAQRKGSRNVGSGLKPNKPGAHWSMDMKGGYVPCYHWKYDSVHIFECLATGKGFICGFKGPHSAEKLCQGI